MIEHKLPTGDTLLLVEVPKDSYDFELHPPEIGENFESISYWFPIDEREQGKEPIASVICLEHGKHTLLGSFIPSLNQTEIIPMDIDHLWVERGENMASGYREYQPNKKGKVHYGLTKINSFISLLKSLTNSKGEKYVVLLKK